MVGEVSHFSAPEKADHTNKKIPSDKIQFIYRQAYNELGEWRSPVRLLHIPKKARSTWALE